MGPADSVAKNFRAALSRAFEEAIRPIRSSTGTLGVLFSGGVDSSLLAWELLRRPEVALYTVGREGSHDLRAGREGAERLGLPWRGLPVGLHEVRGAFDRFEEELAGLPDVTRAVLVALALAIERASPPRLVCGQGVDELFLGYAHYRNLSPVDVELRARADLEKLHRVDWPRTQRIAAKSRKELLAPFLAPPFEEEALRIPTELRLPGDAPKKFFREWAVERGLPPEVAYRPKKAVQYGSGVATLVRRLGRAGV